MIPWNRCWVLPALGLVAFVAMFSQPLRAAEISPRFDVRLITDVDPDGTSYGSMPHSFTQVGDKVYFIAGGFIGNDELWVTGGDAASTHQVSPGFSVGTIGASGDRLFLYGQAASAEIGLWKIDSALPAPYLVWQLQSATFQNYAGDFFDLNGTMLMYATDDLYGYEPWSSNGTTNTTRMLVDTAQGPASAPMLHPMVEHNGRAYFTHFNMIENGPYQFSLWSTDGSSAGTIPVFSAPTYLGSPFKFKSRVCFPKAGSTVYELWCSDGTTAGTARVAALGSVYLDLIYDRFVATSSHVYYRAYTVELGEELWVTDGTTAGTRPISNIPGASIDTVGEIVNVGGKIFFTVTADGFETLLWVVDEDSQGATALTANATTAEEYLWPRLLTDFNGVLAFSASRADSSEEIWMSDGTPIGTKRVVHFAWHSPWPMRELKVIGQSLYFDGDGGEGREPWVWTNQRPQAVEDKFRLDEGHWMTLDVLANDVDDGTLAPDSIEIVEQPRFGEAAVVDGKIRYKGARAMAADRLTYRVRDTQGLISNAANVSVGRVMGAGAIELAWLLLLTFACIIKYAMPTRKI